jgi:hypothetical protein
MLSRPYFYSVLLWPILCFRDVSGTQLRQQFRRTGPRDCRRCGGLTCGPRLAPPRTSGVILARCPKERRTDDNIKTLEIGKRKSRITFRPSPSRITFPSDTRLVARKYPAPGLRWEVACRWSCFQYPAPARSDTLHLWAGPLRRVRIATINAL